MTLMENVSVYGFTFIRKMSFEGHPQFLSACDTLRM